jgi:hypothetical protein
MAATGLLGFNPYGKTQALDISSKPTQLAIQLEQREQAKRESLDKYFMDYEKTLNPAGMRGQDQDVFLGKLGEAKQYYLKNRDKILNPAKYGADAQSNYLSYLKEAQSIIGESKAQGADDKVVSERVYQALQQGKSLHDGLVPMIDASHYNIRDPRFKKVDPYALQFDNPFKEDVFLKTTYGNIKPDKKWVTSKKAPDGRTIDIFETSLSPDDKISVANRAINLYKTDNATANYVNDLIKTGEYGSLNPYFKQLFPKEDLSSATPEHVAAALALSMNQIGSKTESAPAFKYDPYMMMMASRNAPKDEYSPQEHVDAIFGDADKSIGSLTIEGKNIKGVKVQLPEEVASKYERKIGNTKFSPDFFYMTNDKKDVYPIYLDPQGRKTTTSGAPILDVKLSERIPVETNLIPTMGKVFGGQTYTRQNLYTGEAKSGTKTGTKGSSGINWKNKKK